MKTIISKINAKGITSIKGLALVSKTSYEVIFYGSVKGTIIQSNNMIEENLIDSVFLDQIYEEIANNVKKSSEYDSESLNVVIFDDKGISSFKKQDRSCSLYSIKKEWKKSIVG
ncbi:MAG: hypothetical protein MJ235_08320 [archaeon]|nr:hypothetical protein [archaeon]